MSTLGATNVALMVKIFERIKLHKGQYVYSYACGEKLFDGLRNMIYVANDTHKDVRAIHNENEILVRYEPDWELMWHRALQRYSTNCIAKFEAANKADE